MRCPTESAEVSYDEYPPGVARSVTARVSRTSLTLTGIHLYLGVFAPFTTSGRAIQFTVIALALLVGPLLYWTSYWRPILYLLGASLAVYLGVLWSLSGMGYFLVGVRTGIVALGIYLFVRSEAAATGA